MLARERMVNALARALVAQPYPLFDWLVLGALALDVPGGRLTSFEPIDSLTAVAGKFRELIRREVVKLTPGSGSLVLFGHCDQSADCRASSA